MHLGFLFLVGLICVLFLFVFVVVVCLFAFLGFFFFFVSSDSVVLKASIHD